MSRYYISEEDIKAVECFRLPRYTEIPDVGLYLKQVVKYINDSMCEAAGVKVTETMLSNYVKMHMIASPVKKQYSRSRIAGLIMITIMKTAASLEDIKYYIEEMALSGREFCSESTYTGFADEYISALRQAYGIGRPDGAAVTIDDDDAGQCENRKDAEQWNNLMTEIIRNAVGRQYLDACFRSLRYKEKKELI